MHISDKGLNLIKEFEGCYLDAYRDCVGVLTIGYGHTEGVYEGQHLGSEQEALELLRQDLANKYEPYVNSCPTLTFTPNQNQFDALVSFVYNCGDGSLNTLCRNRSAEQVANAIPLYNKGQNGVVYQGLVRRRKAERELFLNGDCGPSRDCNSPIGGNGKIAELQRICGVDDDGIWGPVTDNAVRNLPLAGLPYCTPQLTTWIQLRLGCNPDGVFGSVTADAVKGWQSSHGLTVDGIAGYNTIKSLALA